MPDGSTALAMDHAHQRGPPLPSGVSGYALGLGLKTTLTVAAHPAASPSPPPPLLSPRVVKGKCALGPFLSILVIECQHKCLSENLCQLMDKAQIKSKGMFLDLVHCFEN
jgi:hypothetical protein